MELVLYALLAWNVVAFLLYGWDKLCAIRSRRRVSEKTLLTVAFLAGGVGAWIGSRTFRHKTAKPTFYWPLRVAVVLNLMLYGAVAYEWWRD